MLCLVCRVIRQIMKKVLVKYYGDVESGPATSQLDFENDPVRDLNRSFENCDSLSELRFVKNII